MDNINQKAAAHAIAQIFCDYNYNEIAQEATEKWKAGGCKGDSDVLIARELWSNYVVVYDEVINAAVQEPEL